jgi:hypothetical protein
MSEQRSGRQVISDISELKVKPSGSSALVKVADHLSGWVNVRSYGAKGDGVTDDTAAIQAAIDAAEAGSRHVEIPYTGAPYLISAALTTTTGVTIMGTGPRPRIQQTNAAVPVLVINSNEPVAAYRTFHVENLYFYGGTIGLHVTGTQYIARFSRFVQLDFYAQSHAGIRIDNDPVNGGDIGTYWSGINVEGPAPEYGIIALGYQMLNGSRWDNIRVKGATVAGWHIEDTVAGSTTTAIGIYSPIIESCAGSGLVIKKAQVSIYSGHFENNGSVTGGPDIAIEGGATRTEVSLYDGFFTSPGAAQGNVRIKFTGPTVWLRLFGTRFRSSPHDVIDGNGQSSGSRILMAHISADVDVVNFTSPVARLDHDAVRMTLGAVVGQPALAQGAMADDGAAVGVKLDTGAALTNASARIAAFTNGGTYKAGVDINGNAKFSGDRVVIGQPGSTGSYVHATDIISETGTTARLQLRGQNPDGASAVGVAVGNTTALTAAGARAFEVFSDGLATEAASIRRNAATWGVRLKSPDGTWYLLTIANGGTVSVTVDP